MPTAFLSHSSKDKATYIDYVATKLKRSWRVYDQDTFGIGLKTLDEIFASLEATDLFVLFLSDSSLNSDWVKKEIVQANSLYIANKLTRIFPVIIDSQISHNDLRIPDWMKSEYNLRLVQRPSVATRLIEQRLRELSWKDHPRLKAKRKVIVGRNEEISSIEERFNDYDKPTPLCVIASGLPSIGRRTLLSHAIKKASALPSDSYTPPHIILTPQDSIEDFCLKVYDLGFSAEQNLIQNLQGTRAVKLQIALQLCTDVFQAGDFLFIEDNGCIVTYERKISDWFSELLSALGKLHQLGFTIAARFRPDFREIRTNAIFHFPVPELSPKDRIGLLKRLSDIEQAPLAPADYDYFKDVLSGYPEQVHFLLAMISEEGLAYAKSNTPILVEFNRNKAEALIKATVKSPEELDILMLLSQFEFISFDLLSTFINLKEHQSTINGFIGAALCELLGSSKEYLRVNDTIRDHLARQRLGLPQKYSSALLEHAQAFVRTYTPEELDASDYVFSMQKALAAGENIPDRFLIPSHFLKAMKELYDKSRKYEDVVRLADRVLQSSPYLDSNLERELRYFLCMSLARLRRKRFTEEVRHIAGPEHDFLFGFYYRMTGRVAEAIERQSRAMLQTRTASRARRELVQLYVSVEDYDSAFDLPPPSRTKLNSRKSVNQENDGHEEKQVHRRTDHRIHQAGRSRHAHQGALQEGRLQRCHLLQVARQVRRHGRSRRQAPEGT